jgi:O-antigen/teichoic acid export membrane protein
VPKLRTNILTNYAGQAWIALMNIAFIPVYVRILGAEAFGLVGMMLSLQAIALLLDFGMGGVLNREIARRSHLAEASATIGVLVRTFEWIIWPLAIAIAVLISAVAPALANHWLHAEHLSSSTVDGAIRLIGVAVAMLWPTSFYSNGLSGLERQPTLNAIAATFATLRSAGVIGILYYVSPTIEAFLWWNVFVNGLNSLVVAVALWRHVPRGDRPEFQRTELSAAGRFAGGLVAITALAVALSQLDRIVLSNRLPLAELGYYTVAVSIVAGIGRMIQPMFNAIYPRFSRLVAVDDQSGLRTLYHLGNQCLAPLVAATSCMLAVFAGDVVFLWTGDSGLAIRVAPPLMILVAGTALNGLLNLPYALQLANGWTRLTVMTNFVCLMLGVPFCIWAVDHYGLVGAALLTFAVNFVNFFVNIPIMHSRLLKGELSAFYLHDVLPAFVTAGLVAALARLALSPLSRGLASIIELAVAGAACLLASAASMPLLRGWGLGRLTSWRNAA